MVLQGIGRMQEIYKKCNKGEKLIVPTLKNIVHMELKRIIKGKKNPEGTLFNNHDLLDMMNGLRELNI